jgi:WD40 repeat protein
VIPPSLSPQGNFLAVLTGTHLEIYATPDLHIIRRFPTTCSTGTIITWAPGSVNRSSQRILLQTDDGVHIWDVKDPEWKATLTNGSGGMGKVVSAKLSALGEEALVISDFGSRLTIWSLDDLPAGSINGVHVPIKLTQHIEIRDPKILLSGSTTESCFAFRPRNQDDTLVPLFALLSRQGSQDVLSIHAPQSYALLASTVLPTLDAQGLKWSPDGRWLAIWDTPSAGPRVWIFTADGNLFRSWSTAGSEEEGGEQLGVKSLDWCPNSRFLAIGAFDGKVTVLGTRTVSFRAS